MLWTLATLAAAALQTARNAAQAGLAPRIGTLPATAVRFVFALPVALAGLAALVLAGAPLPRPGAASIAWTALGAGAQIAATALMLTAFARRGQGVATALTKTEPALLALMAVPLLGEVPSLAQAAAIAVATAGVLLLARRRGAGAERAADGRAVLAGIAAGGLFGLSAIGFRAGILALPDGAPVLRAAVVLTVALALQSAASLAWLALADRAGLRAMAAAWRPSAAAGILGAAASLMWFLAFALAPAALVRTLALAELPMAQAVARRRGGAALRRSEIAGLALVATGVALLLAASA